MKKSRDLAARVTLVLVSTLVAVLLAEGALRLFHPITIMAVERPEKADGEFVHDEVLGMRPVLGTGAYDAKGILLSRSRIREAAGARKILLLGDSVTDRGEIVRPLGDLLPCENVSLLNGAVSGYNLQQEVEFFLRYQRETRPQIIVHQWHVNDLRSSRWAIRTGGRIAIYSPRVQPQNINPWLYSHVHLYRFYVANLQSRFSQDELRTGAREALRRLRDHARENGIAYQAFLFPILEPLSQWSDYDRTSREDLLAIARELDLPVLDLLPLAERMIAAGIDPKQGPGDTWHPSAAFGKEAAKLIADTTPALKSLSAACPATR
jgi:hypothetical protein